MLQIKIAVNVPLEAAMARGSAEFGNADVALDVDAIHRLSPAARGLVARAEVSGGVLFIRPGQRRLEVDAATIEATLAMLESIAHAEETQRAQARSVAERARDGAVVYAEGIPDLTRAVDEGYDLDSAVADHVMEQLKATLVRDAGRTIDQMRVLMADTREFVEARWEERSSPRPYGFEVLDSVTRAVATVTIPDGWKLEVTRLMRFRANNRAQGRTAIFVVLSSPVTKDRNLVVDAESLS